MMMWIVPPTEYPGQLAHVECFLHDAFTGERGVAMKQDAEPVPSLVVTPAVLPGTQAADSDRIDVFEMTRIEAQGESKLLSLRAHPVATVAQMVLHVSAPLVMHVVKVGELTEDLLRVLPDDIG